jgi:hypothetical protein
MDLPSTIQAFAQKCKLSRKLENKRKRRQNKQSNWPIHNVPLLLLRLLVKLVPLLLLLRLLVKLVPL